MKLLFSKYKEHKYIVNIFGLLIFITLISHLFRNHLDVINITLLHIIPVIIVAINGKLRSTLLIAFICVILLNFLHIPPLYSFSVHNDYHILSFIFFGVIGGIITYQAKNLDSQKKQNEIRESLLNIISHDLKTPLSTIQGSVNLMLSNSNLDEKSKYSLLEDINYSSQRMKRLITNILDSTRLSNKNIDIKHQWCDFEDILGVALDEFSQMQNDEKLIIKIDELSLFWGDNTLLTQLFINLLDNAFKYSKKGTKIYFEITNYKKHVKIKIFNENEIIDKEKLRSIFDKFYRAEDSNDILGSGIGLSICKSIVKLHNGKIEAIAKNNGISIEVDLPIIKKVRI
ncbi:sensor histidine kinase [Halarcobacter ebronensis]|uniref:histidine kinase n=1 Tax=Halarcobacter ebronensis TaxID=1462615 RepID=A0A4Q1ALW2_9BACT|nr:ATP-binding protein [Halarcobacter ebronensis]QKF81905.1 two-component system sensor histidine kinase [Halarcobacter ebronensis]RXK04374.1 sensor histidine kinase [Halarcobacter ebronensis]